jgi:hypothetical protein
MNIATVPEHANAESVANLESVLENAHDSLVQLPREISYGSPLDQAALYQTLITWAGDRRARVARLPFSQAELSIDPSEFRLTDLAFVLATVCGRLESSDGSDITAEVRRSRLGDRLSRQGFRAGETGGPDAILLAADDSRLSASSELSSVRSKTADSNARTLYYRVSLDSSDREQDRAALGEGEEVLSDAWQRRYLIRTRYPVGHPKRDNAIFTPLGARVLQLTDADLIRWEGAHPRGSSPADWLGEALFELIQNVERHASTSLRGAPLPYAISGLLVDTRSVSSLTKGATPGSPSANFISRLAAATRPRPSRLVAVTVIDSGEGLAHTAARRIAGASIRSESDEIHFLKQALAGTPQGQGRPLHGFGLARVSDLLSELGGFVRIRSGSLSVFRDFIAHPLKRPNDSVTNWQFDHADGGHNRRGAAVTLLIPVGGEA